MGTTNRLGLPLLAIGQAQKDITHNEALLALDAVVQGVCETGPVNTPPAAPTAGSIYLCGPAPSGAWANHAGALAAYSEFGWRFTPPFVGMRVIDGQTGCHWEYRSGQWQFGKLHAAEVRIEGSKVLGAQQASISAAAGGSVVDIEARATLAQVLAALRAHGLIAS